MKWWRWLVGSTYPDLDRRLVERRGACQCRERTEEDKQQDSEFRIEVDRRLHRNARELDVLRREG